MSTKLFNYTNQRINAEKLREILAFNSDSFGGIISKDGSSPFKISGNTVILNASEENPVSLLGGGVLLNETSNNPSPYCSFVSDNQMWILEVELDSSEANITTDELNNKINYKSINCDVIESTNKYYSFPVVSIAEGDPSTNQYYEHIIDEEGKDKFILSTDTEVDRDKTYYYKIEVESFRFISNSYTGPAICSYYGNTIWTSDTTFFIPLFAKINGEIIQLISIRTLDDFESLLTASAYARLKAYVDGTFVWSVGGTDEVIAPDGSKHRKGDIGKLNITDDVISQNDGGSVKISDLSLLSLRGDNDQHTKLVVNSSGNISVVRDYVQPIAHGGTGATDRAKAKSNLGIYYGTSQTPVGGGPYQEGDLYLWIIQ